MGISDELAVSAQSVTATLLLQPPSGKSNRICLVAVMEFQIWEAARDQCYFLTRARVNQMNGNLILNKWYLSNTENPQGWVRPVSRRPLQC